MVKRTRDQKLRSRNFEARTERIQTSAVFTNRRSHCSVERVSGECWQWTGNDSVLKVTVVVSGTMRISVQNRHQCPLLPLNHRQKKMVKTIREKGVLEAAVAQGS